MPSVWFALKRSMTCKARQCDVHNPRKIVRRTTSRRNRDCPVLSSGCSVSIPNVNFNVNKVLNRNRTKRYMQKSQQHVGSNTEPINPIVQAVVRNNRTTELKIRNGSGRPIGTLVPGTPGPGEHMSPSLSDGSRNLNKSVGKSDSFRKRILSSGISAIQRRHRGSRRSESDIDVSAFPCLRCGKKFFKLQDVEAHHLSNHAVTELSEGDSSRNIVQLICISGLLKSNLSCDIEGILKVHNLQQNISKFEEFREQVKLKASELSKKHPRCLADGNELLRFHGTTTECSLGINGSSSLCLSEECGVCRILRHGFSSNKKEVDHCAGVFTTSCSEKALASINMVDSNNINSRKAVIVCRVIAGMVHVPVENIKERDNQPEFDSLAGKEDLNSNIQELFLLNPRAILPCFVIICKP